MRELKVGFAPLYRVEFPSSRYRVFQFFEPLRKRGFQCSWIEAPQRSLKMRLFYLPRLLHLALVSDVLYVQKRSFPLWVLKLVQHANPHIVYDLDDAIYLDPAYHVLVSEMMRGAAIVVAGNEYLAAFARRFSKQVMVIPTVVDMDLYCPPVGARHPGDDRIIIGWIGMDPNRGDLVPMKAVFDYLGERYGAQVVLRIVSSRPLEMQTKLRVEFVPWKLHSSRRELRKFDIGIMPLPDDEWNRGKCGFKLIQYMAVAAPAVASPVGVNQEIVQDGRTGYLAGRTEDWCDRLQRLVDDQASRVQMGRAGRKRAELRYSVESVLPVLTQVLERGAMRLLTGA